MVVMMHTLLHTSLKDYVVMSYFCCVSNKVVIIVCEGDFRCSYDCYHDVFHMKNSEIFNIFVH